MRSQLKIGGTGWFACGLSLSFIRGTPTFRRFISTGCSSCDSDDGLCRIAGFGGTDLTPYYLFEEDAMHFHRVYKTVATNPIPLLPPFKKCDQYFVNTHRNGERRGIPWGFYDHQRSGGGEGCVLDEFCRLRRSLPGSLSSHRRKKDLPFGEQERHWQEIRRDVMWSLTWYTTAELCSVCAQVAGSKVS